MKALPAAVSSVLIGGLILVGGASPASAQAVDVPASLQLTPGVKEALQGEEVAVTIGVRNFRDQPIAAPRPIDVSIESDLLRQPVRLTIGAGSRSANARIVFDRPGLARLRATAPKLPVAYAIVAIKPSSRRGMLDRSPWSVMALALREIVPDVFATALSPMLAQVPSARPWLEVLPPRVTARNGVWTARIVVGLVNVHGEPIEAPHDVPIQIAAEVGSLERDVVVIAKGSSTAREDVRIRAQKPGDDMVYAVVVPTGGKAESRIEYERSRPSKLFVSSTPAEAVTSGRTTVQVGVILKDDDDHVVQNPDADLRVMLRSTLGTLSRNVVTVATGRADSDWVQLSSGRTGRATITAEADGLEDDAEMVPFVLPWLLVVLAASGGVTGAVLRSGRNRGRNLWHDLAIGGVLGIVFFGLALFDVPGAIPAIPVVALEKLTFNEIGAFLVGLLGGYMGRRHLDVMLLPTRSPSVVEAA